MIVSMLSPRTERASKLIPPDEFSALIQLEGQPISGVEYTCAATALLGKAANKTSADATEIARLYKYVISTMQLLAEDAERCAELANHVVHHEELTPSKLKARASELQSSLDHFVEHGVMWGGNFPLLHSRAADWSRIGAAWGGFPRL